MIRARELNVLWSKVHPTVSAYIRSTIRDFHCAEDVLQETAATVAEKFAEYDSSRPFLPWVIGISKNKLLTHLRKYCSDRHVFSDRLIEQITEIYAADDMDTSAMHEALKTCIKEVSGKPRKLLEMRYVRELKPGKIAAVTGMTTNSVSVMLFRVRKALQNCIERQLATAKFDGQAEQGGGA